MGSVDVHLGLVYWAVWAELASQPFVCVGFLLVLFSHFREPRSGRGRVDRTIPGAVAPRWPPTSSFPLRLRVPGLTPAARGVVVSLPSLSCNIQAVREMASAASSRCSGLLLPPSLAGAHCCPRPSSSLRFRSRSARRRPGTLACVAPPDSAEQQTVRSDSTPKAPLPCPRIVISRRRSGSVIFFSSNSVQVIVLVELPTCAYGRGHKHVTGILQS